MDNFNHAQFAHCESGVLSTLLSHNGLTISEPMVFGITSSLSFIFFPFIKLNNMPLISYREVPKNIVKKLPSILHVNMITKTYKNQIQAQEELENYVNNGILVGLQTSVFYLPYFPKDMRFHFNAHNLMVCKKEGDDYIISDPVFEELTKCDKNSLNKARFSKGVFAPKGFLYYPKDIPKNLDFTPILKKAIIRNSKRMLSPFPFAGVKGMRKLANKLATFSQKTEKRFLINYLTHIVRMQEEIGTGGGGFRFLYSAFLEEAKKYELDNVKLQTASQMLENSGDLLRKFALLCVQSCKHLDTFDSKMLKNALYEVAKLEEEAFRILKTI